ncbi:formylmethanofuran dehydrogenase subunit B [Desulfococcaceae bacterium HSG7]|nr:formylmethanofuran dehydrogenase subunit B [Desulfococcaceae bacterium HSG7]
MSVLIDNITCKFCGCLCDDITVEVEGDRILKAKRACPNGRGMFLNYDPTPQKPYVDGQVVEWDEAVTAAADILNKADSPLIYGLSSTSTEAQRKAVELADRLGAIIDSTSSVCHFPTSLAVQTVGEATCTLGEVKDRADLLIFWGCNPLVSHIRHFSRYSANAKGLLTPNGRKDRTVVAVDVRLTQTAKIADHFLQITPGNDYEVLTSLRALIQEKNIEHDVGGIALEQLEELAYMMKNCRYGVIFFGMGLTMTPGRNYNVAELFTLGAELNRYNRFSVIPMRGHGNVAGADQVLTWLSGYPTAVSFARGYPQFGPGEFTTVDVLSRGEADAALIVASDPMAHLPRMAAKNLERIPLIVMAPTPNCSSKVAKVVLPTACYGIDAPGTSYRMDNVPLRLRAVFPNTRPTDEEIFSRIIKAVKQC